MAQVLEKGYALDQHYPPLLNLLAHHYATKGNNVARASELIAAACTLDPHNPHILDTKALIMYKQQEYAQAHELLTTLHKSNPHDATILIHLAQVEYRQDHADIARNLLRSAQSYTHTPYEKQKIASLTKKLETKVLISK
jgi:predicted Zn-dependent protease